MIPDRCSGSRRIAGAIAIVLLPLFLSACRPDPGNGLAGIRNVILVVGDGFQLEHERAYNNYLTGSYDRGLRHWQFDYQGAVATWDLTTYNRYARSAGAPTISDERFDPRQRATYDIRHGYDVARGGALPYPQSPLAAVNSAAALGYFGTRLAAGEGDPARIPATDSASAATALSTGFKTDDGNIAWRSGDKPDGALKTIAEMLRAQKGGAFGVVSTVPFSHATPAGFVSHNVSRNHYQAIAREIITSVKPDVVIGAGHPDFTSVTGKPDYAFVAAPELQALRDSAEYVLVERQAGNDGGAALQAGADRAAASGKKLFGLFGGAGGQFEFHRPSADGSSVVERGSAENPTLAEASTAALRVLGKNRNGFFLMIEQGDIDWANHANDFRAMIGGMWDLDQAVRAVEAFVDQPGDDIDWNNTVLIVTSDHANSFLRIDTTKKLGKGRLPLQQAQQAGRTGRGSIVYPDKEVSYGIDGNGVNAHFNEPVTVYARGPAVIAALFRQREGLWYAASRLLDNTHLFEIMMESLGLADENRRR